MLPALLSFFNPFSPSLPHTSCLSGTGLHNLSWWLGQWRGSADVRRADRQVQPGGLLSALGLHLGYHGHPGRSHPLLPGLCPGEPAERTHDRRAAGWEQGWECPLWPNVITYWSPFGKFTLRLCIVLEVRVERSTHGACWDSTECSIDLPGVGFNTHPWCGSFFFGLCGSRQIRLKVHSQGNSCNNGLVKS